MKRKMLFTLALVVALVALFAISASAAAPLPQKPTLSVDFGAVTEIPGFTPPSQLFVNTDERVVLTDGNGNYVTYPTYYVTKDSTTFDFNFSALNTATGITYSKASVVLLEIPNGITAISNSYFAGTGNFPKCISVQFPGSVTSYGSSLFAGANTVIRCVEFLDGTTPVTMGDSMFGGQWNGGANAIEYVKFPNNLTSIGNNTFGKAKGASKTIIFGENLASIGTGFFGESTPNNTDTFLYVSDNFFSDTSKVFANLFGTSAPYHGNQLRLTIFYTGTLEQAEKLAAACAELQTGYCFNDGRVTFVSANDYVYENHKPKSDLSATIVYDYNKCDAFYNGEHVGEDYDCTTANVCTNCGKSSPKEADTHNLVETLVYANGFDKAGLYNCICDRAGCTMAGKEIIDEEKDPIVTFLGYSVPETKGVTGINAGFKVEKDLLDDYNDINEVDATLTLFMVNCKSENVNISKIFEDGTLELADGVKGINVAITSTSYTNISVEVRGFALEDEKGAQGNYYTLKLITAIAVKTEEGTHFVQAGLEAGSDKQAVDGVDFNIVSAENVYNAVAE